MTEVIHHRMLRVIDFRVFSADSLPASPNIQTTAYLRAVYILEKGLHGLLREAKDYENALRDSFPYFSDVSHLPAFRTHGLPADDHPHVTIHTSHRPPSQDCNFTSV